MKLIIAGSNYNYIDLKILEDYISKHIDVHDIKEIVASNNGKVDSLAKDLSEKLKIKLTVRKPRWARDGSNAVRNLNESMANEADKLFLIWNKESPELTQLKDYMKSLGKEVNEVNY